MRDIKTLEKELNNMNDSRDAIKSLSAIAENKRGKIDILEFALSGCEEKEKDILTRVCINCEDVEDIAHDYNITGRQIYNLKNNALKSLLRRLYGKEVNE